MVIPNYLSFVILYFMCLKFGHSIDCFKCISVNHDNPACDDRFHNNYSTEFFEAPCMGGRKGRDGLYPATSCVKISGKFDDNGQVLTVRSCALDSGTLTIDTELVRMSHCGGFYYDNRYVRGCVQTCNDADGCNHSPPTIRSIFLFTIISVLSSISSQLYIVC